MPFDKIPKISAKEFDMKEVAVQEVPEDNMRRFYEIAQFGLQLFKDGDLTGAISTLQQAANVNSTQPLGQLGILLYLNEEYQEASEQLNRDVKKIEARKLMKATEFRLWQCAALMQLKQTKDAILALDLNGWNTPGIFEDRLLMNRTLHFFGGDASIEELLSIIGSADERDFSGRSFFGNFYLALYHDSVGNKELAKAFLSFPAESNKYPSNDMWHHLPRMFYRRRFPDGW